jgi:hypothetical protein
MGERGMGKVIKALGFQEGGFRLLDPGSDGAAVLGLQGSRDGSDLGPSDPRLSRQCARAQPELYCSFFVENCPSAKSSPAFLHVPQPNPGLTQSCLVYYASTSISKFIIF